MTEEGKKGAAMQPTNEEPTSFRLVPPVDFSGTPTLYANFVQVTASPHDFRLLFSQYAFPPVGEPAPPEVEVPIHPLAGVTIPLNLVKGLIRALEGQVENWEKGFNEPIPEQPNPNDAQGTE